MNANSELIELGIIGLADSNKKKKWWNKILKKEVAKYILVLSKSDDENQRIPLVIGKFEAQAIATVIENVTLPNPCTHDLFRNATIKFGFSLKSIVINKFKEGIFSCTMNYSDGKTDIELTARTSDAIALAIRHKCQIFITKKVYEEVVIL
ncbi:bifunctional nuclease family protein [Bernardetia sp. ABR2-2B]|uniref:bifunctional nuclease family protein n=1 Tax=Bernardetia sp. ABR2-2B TaxID=3127472 RepID=UPI0030D08A32